MPDDQATILLKKNLCGALGGIFQAILFNPWDRALYLCAFNGRTFLHRDNFRKPFTGLYQTIFHRSLASGIYFPLEDTITSIYFPLFNIDRKDKTVKSAVGHWVVGMISGAINGMIINPVAAVKFHFWGKVDCGSETFFSTAKDMFKKGGVRPFLVGINSTIVRDVIFGGTFTLFRHNMPMIKTDSSLDGNQVYINMISGLIATVLSSPMNYVRNVQYSTSPSEPTKTARMILRSLITEIKDISITEGIFNAARVLGFKLRIGWGTLRVGCGMAIGSFLYDALIKIVVNEN